MDFDFNEAEQAIADLTAQILDDKVTHETLRELEQSGQYVDHATWATLAESGIIGAALPEKYGGAGLGFLAVTAAIEQVGSHAALTPLLETVVMAALPIAEFGTDAQLADLLPGVADGSTLATAALAPGSNVAVTGGELTGSVRAVTNARDAQLVLVPADDGVWILHGDTTWSDGATGVTVTERQTTTGHPQATIVFDNTPARRLGTVSAEDFLTWTKLRVDSAICSTLAGACRAALALGSEYAQVRQQFDRAIATFQAVSQRAGDAYIDTEAVNLTSRQAAWRISAGRDADEQVAIARWWASEAGFRVMHASTHIHGGVGVDRDYPLHRYFLMTRQLELTLGNSEEQLDRLGDLIAARD